MMARGVHTDGGAVAHSSAATGTIAAAPQTTE